MLQDLTDIDFDTYFDVSSSNQQLYDNNSFDLLDWNLLTSPQSSSSDSPQQFFIKKPFFSNVQSINIPHSDPILATNTSIPSPPLDSYWQKEDHETRNWRKLSTRNQQLLQQPNTFQFEPGKQLKKVAHNAIERRYRNNINDRIKELKNVVPALYKAKIVKEKGDDDDNSSDSEALLDGVQAAKKLNKATILKKATEYIEHLKYTNNKTEQENQILQQIIAQMPGGRDVLSSFLHQKANFEKMKQEQLARERRENQEREKLERQRILRERAAQRAALAQLLPKPERKPYRRRQSSKAKSDTSDDDKGNKMFMAAFMCITFFTSSSSIVKTTNDHQVYEKEYDTRTTG